MLNPLEWKLNEQTNNSSLPVLISLGSNINPEKNILAAVKLLSESVDRLSISSVWESSAVGSSGPNYLKCAAQFLTQLPLEKIKSNVISPIETQLGRVRSANKYMDRSIDLDVLVYGESIIDSELWFHGYLAIPASELMPDLLNQETGESLLETADRLRKSTKIFQRLDLDGGK